MREPNELLMIFCRYLMDNNASDFHLTDEGKPCARIGGIIYPMPFAPLSKEDRIKVFLGCITDGQKREFDVIKAVDYAIGDSVIGRYRINVYQQRGKITAAIRRLPPSIPSFDELGLPSDAIKKICGYHKGFVIVSGATGSGKSTTLASMIDYINSTRNCHIISVEDPIEYVHQDIKSIVHQREIGFDAPSFSIALKYILREDPDVVFVGEMRDLDTISVALTIAETGHLVFATLHTGESSESISRIVDVFPPMQQSQIVKQLSFALTGVVNQMLLPTAADDKLALATEIMLNTPAIKNIIRENKTEHIYSHIQMGGHLGMQTMNQSLLQLVRSGKITQEVALANSKHADELEKMMEKVYA